MPPMLKRFSFSRLLIFLGLRDPFDVVPPFCPEVPHPFVKHPALNCCDHCGGGKLHAIHKPPYNPRRTAEVLGHSNVMVPPRGPYGGNYIEREH
jgi:hypothetical protein